MNDEQLKIIAFVDKFGRNIIGAYKEENEKETHVYTPCVLAIRHEPIIQKDDNGNEVPTGNFRSHVDLDPIFHPQLSSNGVVAISFNKNEITPVDIELTENIKQHYMQLSGVMNILNQVDMNDNEPVLFESDDE